MVWRHVEVRGGSVAPGLSCRASAASRRSEPALRVARSILAAALACGVLGQGPRLDRVLAQVDTRPTAAELLESMSAEERVGQMLLVPIDGADVADGSAIAHLIDDLHVGGVVLDSRRGNFSNGADAPMQVAKLANALQRRTAAAGRPYVPLLVAVTQLGEEPPGTALSGGMTVLPTQMTVGATWQPELADQVGQVIGRELAAVGVNLLLGPNLDVAAVPRPGTSGDLGTRVFGGSPSWVARLGQAFVRGVRQGSNGRVATACASFPGLGGADRSPADEAAVVESSLPELLAADLAPYLAVTDHSTDATTAAVISSHARYRALQQQTDRPFSLDTGGMGYLWAQVPQLKRWRDAGGVVVSSGLGLPTVRRYADPSLTEFSVRRVVDEAVTAGNDLLLLTDFGPPGATSAADANIDAAVQWLLVRYRQDEAVRELVDAAALRVLGLKLGLHPDAALERVLVDPELAPAATGLGADVTGQVGAAALTLISPGAALPAGPGVVAPQSGETILFVADERAVRECAECEPTTVLSPAELVDRVRQRYGPAGSGRLLREDQVEGVTFSEMKAWLQGRGAVATEDTPVLVPELDPARAAEIGRWVDRSDWIVFAMRDARPAEAPGSDAMKLFLKAAVVDAQDRRLVALAFGAPYYLDTTEIAKLHAYYAVYARGSPFVDLAVRALFGDAAATGASPVSVSGAGYDLGRRLEPALDQRVELEPVGHDAAQPLRAGGDLTVRSSVVLDGNGRPAPDGTTVTLRRYAGADGVFLPDVPAALRDGRLAEVIALERAGEMTITAVFENGLRSAPLDLRIEDRSAAADLLDGVSIPDQLIAPVRVGWSMLLLSLTLVALAGVIAYGLGTEGRSPPASGRLALSCIAWGLAGYLLVAAGGIPLGRSPSSLPLWPSGWPDAYLAPVLSVVFALVPLLPTLAREIRAKVRR